MGKKMKNTCGKRVKILRVENDLLQVELSAEIELEQEVTLTQHAISGIENGTRFVKDTELIALARALKTSPNFLLFGNDLPDEFKQ